MFCYFNSMRIECHRPAVLFPPFLTTRSEISFGASGSPRKPSLPESSSPGGSLSAQSARRFHPRKKFESPRPTPRHRMPVSRKRTTRSLAETFDPRICYRPCLHARLRTASAESFIIAKRSDTDPGPRGRPPAATGRRRPWPLAPLSRTARRPRAGADASIRSPPVRDGAAPA